jgi:thioredoxin reductase (NADPH)
MKDVVIIGKGPAGISAALYTVRANLETTILGNEESAIIKADKIDNYYGFAESISGKDLLRAGEEQAKRIGAKIVNTEVYGIEQMAEGFIVKTSQANYEAKTVLIATGQTLKKADIKNLDKYEGIGVSYCTTCDGFFYKNLAVGVVGSGEYALHEASELETFTKNITIFTNGVELDVKDKSIIEKYEVEKRKIIQINGEESIKSVTLEDGTERDIDGLFIAAGSASGVDFARKMGVLFDGNNIVVDKDQKTNIPGLFAAGDVTGGFKQISTAVGQGAIAGRRIIEFVRQKNNKYMEE